MEDEVNDTVVEDAGDHGSVEEDIREVASVVGEVDGELREGCADEDTIDLKVQGIKGNRAELSRDMETDDTLKVARGLANRDAEGYRWEKGLLLRTRLDQQGQAKDQICLPKAFRRRCMSLAHTKFGHLGRNKMIALLTPHFFWPNMSKDCQDFIRQCPECQKHDKARPPPSPMQLRETVTVPFERVAVDIVGPFPTAKCGYRFLITCIDLATRWPEAVPVRTATARVIIDRLEDIFNHNGYPKSIISDNGSQFVGRVFAKWLARNGISHTKASPYHPQGNGVVERLHQDIRG